MAKTNGVTTKLFGAPYQFTEAVDPRNKDINKNLGYNYFTKFMTEAPVLTIIPGIPRYLPGNKDKKSSALSIYNMANNGDAFGMSNFIKNHANGFTDDHFRLYDFAIAYSEYMDYVNALCRAGASFLELNTAIKIGGNDYTNLLNFDWKNYKWIDKSQKTFSAKKASSNSMNNKIANTRGMNDTNEYDSLEFTTDLLNMQHYVQFYCDPTGSDPGDSFSNSDTRSKLKDVFGTGSEWMKDLGFMMQSGGGSMGEFNQFATESMDSMMDFLGNATSDSGIELLSPISRILNLGGNVLKGENIVIPDIYESSSFDKNYNVRIVLRTPYGNKLSYFMDIFVPLMHLVALVVPRATSANTYKSPFLVKANIRNGWNVVLGLCSSMQVTRTPESKNIDGLPTEVEVNLTIKDLYSELTISRAADPKSFLSNGSLIEYLANNCGISLTSPNFNKKLDLVVNNYTNFWKDIIPNAGSAIEDVVANAVSGFNL